MSNDLRDWFIRRAAGAVPFLMEHFDPAVGCFHPKNWDERYNNVIYALAYLHRTEHPLNPHFASQPVLEAAIASADFYVQTQTSFGEWPHGPSGGYCLAEWPAYYLGETLALLDEGLSEERREQWSKALDLYATHAERRPFSFTSPSNEAWKCLALLRLGQILDRAEWRQSAAYQMGQLAKLQRPEGCWEEPLLGHGSSPAYHHLHLGALGLYALHSGDETVGDSLKRATDFALTAAYPDGAPLDCLDGRAAFSPEAPLSSAPALCRTAAGRRLLSSLTGTIDELRSADARLAFASTWTAFIEPCFLADAHRHFPQAVEADEAGEERDGRWSLGSSSGRRHKPWQVAVCAEASDTALVAPQRSAFERQSRLSVWHDDWGIVLGGGSRARTGFLPLANVMLSTDYRDIGCAFGEVRSLARAEPEDPSELASAYHAARSVSVEDSDDGLAVHLVFGHGDVIFGARAVDETTCEVEFRTSLRGVKSAFCQLPLLLTHHTRLAVDRGSAQPFSIDRPESLTWSIEDRLVLSRPDRDATVLIERPHDARLKLHAPVHPGFGHVEDDHFEPAHACGLLSAAITAPEGDNRLTFVIRVGRATV